MAYNERQKDKILLNLEIEEAKKKGKSKWYINLLVWIVILISLGFVFLVALAMAGGLCQTFSVSLKWMWLTVPIFFVLIFLTFKWKREWEQKKWEQIEKPEYERKTGKGQFANYFNCGECQKTFRVNAEWEKGKCQRCSK